MENKTIEVTGCNDCPYSYRQEYLLYCTLLQTWMSIQYYEDGCYPSWCPLKQKSITIKLKENGK